MARILFCCINGNGLGHITRILALARQVRKLAPDSEILVLTTSEFTHVLAKENIASVKIPSPEIHLKDKRLPIAYLTQAISSQVVALFRPELVVIDSTPTGLIGEYLSFLNIIPKKAFIFGMFPNFISDPRYKFALRFYDQIFMPFEEDQRESVNIDFGARAHWVGHFLVRTREEIFDRSVVRKRMGIGPNERVVYVGLGGGGNPQNDELLKWVLDILSNIPDLKIACPLQPLGTDHSVIFEYENCIPITHYPMIEYYSAFDFSVLSAGKNNIAEATHSGLPALWVPMGHPSTDQNFNAKLFADRGFGKIIKPFDNDDLKKGVDQLMNDEVQDQMRKCMLAWGGGKGAENTARILLNSI